LFLGALLSTHNSIMYATRRARGSVGHYRAAAAAAAAAWALLFLPRGARRVFGLVTFMRALEVGTRMGTQRGWLPVLPHADVALMAAASARVRSAACSHSSPLLVSLSVLVVSLILHLDEGACDGIIVGASDGLGALTVSSFRR